MSENDSDTRWMARSIAVARAWVGATWPNPAVGAVLVNTDGDLVAEGVHRGAGCDHAERDVLKIARQKNIDTRGMTLYVSLEPCHHHGRTPPCTEVIVQAGISKVFYAMADPNPMVEGGGAAFLKSEGIAVEEGLLAEEALALNHAWIECGYGAEVHLTLKLAVSADGKLAGRNGPVEDAALRKISCEESHQRVQQLRAASAAIVVGARTAAWDRPRLSVRDVSLAEGRSQPQAVVLSSHLELAAEDLPERTLLLALEGANSDLFTAAGHRVLPVAASEDGQLSWPSILKLLAGEGLGIVLVEGGGEVASTLLQAEIPHRVHLFRAPHTLGGEGAALNPWPFVHERYSLMLERLCGIDTEQIWLRKNLL